MRQLSTALFTLALSACASGFQTIQPAFAEDNKEVGEIFVTGEASLKVEPDTVSIAGIIFERANDRDQVLQSISTLNTQIEQNLPRLEGVTSYVYSSDQLEIDTVRPNGCAQVNYRNDPIPENCEPVAFSGGLSFSINVQPANIGGDVVSYLTELGVEEVSITGFKVSNEDAYQAQVEALAVEDALSKADMLARASGHVRGRIIQLTDGTLPNMRTEIPIVMEGLIAREDFYSSSPITVTARRRVSLAPPEQTFNAKVQLRVEIKPAD